MEKKESSSTNLGEPEANTLPLEAMCTNFEVRIFLFLNTILFHHIVVK